MFCNFEREIYIPHHIPFENGQHLHATLAILSEYHLIAHDNAQEKTHLTRSAHYLRKFGVAQRDLL
jgi:hypothetical protein